jgi:hypothetical protein
VSWYDEDYLERLPISAVNTAGGATKDVELVIPKDLDIFWEAIDADGDELRVTAADGYTLLTYAVDDGAGGAFNKTTRAGRIRIDGATVPGTANECMLFWLYFDTVSVQGDASAGVAIASAETGYIDRGAPNGWVAAASPPRPGRDRPNSVHGKSASDDGFLFLDVTPLLERRVSDFAGKHYYEEPRAATYEVQLSSTEAAQAAMIDTASTRWLETKDRNGRRLYLRLRVKAGTTDLEYTLVATIPTCVPTQSGTHRTPVPRVGFRVRNVLET